MGRSSVLNFDPRSPAHRFSGGTDSLDGAVGPLLVAAAAFALVVAALDLLTYQVNLPIVYVVPLLLVERAGSRRLLWRAAALLVGLTFAGYFFGRHPPGLEPLDPNSAPRLVNRALAAV